MKNGALAGAFQKLVLPERKSTEAVSESTCIVQLGEEYDDDAAHGSKETGAQLAASNPPTLLPTIVGNGEQSDDDQVTQEHTKSLDPKSWTLVRSRRRNFSKAATTQPVAPSVPDFHSAPLWETDKDWRNRDAEAQKARFAAARTIGQTPQATNAGRTKNTLIPGPHTRGGVPYANQIAGAIFWHWDVRRYVVGQSHPGWNIFTERGVRKLRKGRYWIIVDAEETGFIHEVGIFTNHDTGLQTVPSKFWSGYLSLRPKHIDAKHFRNLIPGNSVLDVGWMASDADGNETKLTRESMVVNWRNVLKRPIDIQDLRIIGELSPEALEVLRKKALPLCTDSFTNKTPSKNLFVLLAKTQTRRDILISCQDKKVLLSCLPSYKFLNE